MPSRIEQAASKAVGAVKGAQARVQGLKGVFSTLAKEHGEVSTLLARCKRSGDAEKRDDLWQKIRGELLAHEEAETQEVYGALRDIPEIERLAEHHDREAAKLEGLIGDLQTMGPASAEWDRRFEELVELVHHHATEEEQQLFPKIQEVIGEGRAKEMEKAFVSTKKQALRRHA